MFRHLLVPTDGSDLSLAAVRQAIALARESAARMTVVHVMERLLLTPQGALFGDAAGFDPELLQRVHQAEQAQAQAVLGEARRLAEAGGVVCDAVLREQGVIHEAILETAASQGCDLIFMASHGRRGLAGLVLGSVTQRVLNHSELPVLVYRQPGSAA
ncbi:MAG: universal stress protein [Synechococcaceae cyanobacterium]|nr:universal stress protein [Synechococcaceae cyanobacterium]